MVVFPHNEGDHSFLCEHLFIAFPPLRDAGGFVLARGCRDHRLEEIPIPAEGYSLIYVRSSTTRAPIYIIPLQRSLTLSPCANDEVCSKESNTAIGFSCHTLLLRFMNFFLLYFVLLPCVVSGLFTWSLSAFPRVFLMCLTCVPLSATHRVLI